VLLVELEMLMSNHALILNFGVLLDNLFVHDVLHYVRCIWRNLLINQSKVHLGKNIVHHIDVLVGTCLSFFIGDIGKVQKVHKSTTDVIIVSSTWRNVGMGDAEQHVVERKKI
jgi:hypothetical protein